MGNISIAKHLVSDHVPTDMEWARLAAYIDGEGHVGIYRRFDKKTRNGNIKRDEHMFITVVNTDPRLVVWCRENFGGKIFVDERLTLLKTKPLYQWKISSGPAQRVLEGCMQYFLLKKEQAEIAIAFQKTRRPVGNREKGRWGAPNPIPEDVLDLREFYHGEIRRLRTEIVPFPEMESSVTN